MMHYFLKDEVLICTSLDEKCGRLQVMTFIDKVVGIPNIFPRINGMQVRVHIYYQGAELAKVVFT